jgi:hypothetical protein
LFPQQRLDLLGELPDLRSARSPGASLRSPSGLATRHPGAIRSLSASSNLVVIVVDIDLLSIDAYSQKVGHSVRAQDRIRVADRKRRQGVLRMVDPRVQSVFRTKCQIASCPGRFYNKRGWE